jgi:pyoverdine/dityrosine biosynthesis protein Dit1
MRATALGATETAHDVLDIILRHQRAAEAGPCVECKAVHLARLRAAIQQGRPISLVLAGFPCKVPDRGQALGRLPDLAERLSLHFLHRLCQEVQGVYSPGARLTLCPEGWVFADLLGVPDEDAAAYARGLRDMIVDGGYWSLDLATSQDLVGECAPAAARRRLLETAGEAGGDEYARRARAWNALLLRRYPGAVHLGAGASGGHDDRIGIHLPGTRGSSLLPWDGVAIDLGGRFALMRRSQAEQMGGSLVWQNGRPSHYVYAG